MIQFPPMVAACLEPQATKDQKMSLAQGILPVPPAVLVAAVSLLLKDADAEITGAAQKTLEGVPVSLLKTILKDTASSEAIDFYARSATSTPDLIELTLLNPNTSDATLIYLSSIANEAQATIIMNNQVRLLQNQAIAEAIKKNPNALKSSVDMMVSFLRINGISLEGETAELSDKEIAELLTFQESGFDLPPELVQEEHELTEPITEEKRKSIYKAIQTMNIASKVKLALKGNKEARSILIKDSNKVVASAVIKSPRITDGEVFSICNMKTVHDEVIRIICNKNDWTKNYNVQVALANNPKTPFPIGLKFTRQLRVPDLVKLSKNKNAPSQLMKIAKELVDQKKV